MRFLDWLLNRQSMFIPNWSDRTMRYYERCNKRELGIVSEPVYAWSQQFRKG